jgi:haloalkane dehalogenase
MLPFERTAIRAGGQDVHVLLAGAGPSVLLLHGNPSWSFVWRKVAAALAGAPLRLVMPDLVGLGLSSKPRDPTFHTIDRHGEIIGEVIDALAPGPLVFVGQDWGGPIGLRALAERPGRLAGLVLANTVVGPPRPGFRATAFHRFARLPLVADFAFRVLGVPQIALGAVQGDRRSISGDVARAYRWPLRRLGDRTAPLALARMVPDSLDHPSVPALRRCQEVIEAWRGPAEIVWGDRDPVLGRVRTHLARLLPQARVTATQAGHFVQEEVPDELAAAIRRVAGVA